MYADIFYGLVAGALIYPVMRFLDFLRGYRFQLSRHIVAGLVAVCTVLVTALPMDGGTVRVFSGVIGYAVAALLFSQIIK